MFRCSPTCSCAGVSYQECGVRISPCYSLLEALTGGLFAIAAYEFGISLVLVWVLGF